MSLAAFSEATNWLTVALAIAVCLVVYLYIKWSRTPSGPVGLPYLGYYTFLSENCHEQLFQMSKKYGKVFCFRVTGQLYAHILDMKTIREVSSTKSHCFEKRPENYTLVKDLFEGGLLYLNGEDWKVFRKYFVQQFKEFGMGRKTQETIMHDSLKKIVTSLRESRGGNFEAVQFFIDIAEGVIRKLIFGDVKLDENDVRDFHKDFAAAVEFLHGVRILFAGPFLRYILMPFVPEYRRYSKHKQQAHSVMAKIIQQHEKDFDKNNIRNLVDAYINERKLLKERENPKSTLFTERVLISSLVQFYGDGAHSVGWLVARILKTLASYPEVQKSIQSEVDEVVGRERLPSSDDKSKLLYTSAAIYEGFRTIKFFYLNPMLECTRETTIAGCRIPEGTITVFNMWAAFRDPEVYDEPDKFDPTRFLRTDGNKPISEIPLSFGVGKRSCSGESLVNMELLLYIATVLQNFDLHPADETAGKTQKSSVLFRATPRAL